jgi:hypothetical protein
MAASSAFVSPKGHVHGAGAIRAEVVAVLRLVESPTIVDVRPWKLPVQTMSSALSFGTPFAV